MKIIVPEQPGLDQFRLVSTYPDHGLVRPESRALTLSEPRHGCIRELVPGEYTLDFLGVMTVFGPFDSGYPIDPSPYSHPYERALNSMPALQAKLSQIYMAELLGTESLKGSFFDAISRIVNVFHGNLIYGFPYLSIFHDDMTQWLYANFGVQCSTKENWYGYKIRSPRMRYIMSETLQERELDPLDIVNVNDGELKSRVLGLFVHPSIHVESLELGLESDLNKIKLQLELMLADYEPSELPTLIFAA